MVLFFPEFPLGLNRKGEGAPSFERDPFASVRIADGWLTKGPFLGR